MYQAFRMALSDYIRLQLNIDKKDLDGNITTSSKKNDDHIYNTSIKYDF